MVRPRGFCDGGGAEGGSDEAVHREENDSLRGGINTGLSTVSSSGEGIRHVPVL